MSESRRYLVTGCAGFIGASLTRRLLDGGHSVIGADNLNDAYDPALKKWRLQHLIGVNPAFEFHVADLADRAEAAKLFNDSNQPPYDAVFHLAARAGVRASVADPAAYIDANIHAAANILEGCRRTGVKKFVLASTSSLYGAANSTPYREDANTDHPLSPYAATKKAAEALAYSFHHLHKLDVSILRYFTVYGPAGRPDMSVFRFLRRIDAEKPVVLYGDGSQQRDFTYIDDIVSGTIAAAAPCGYDIFNLGGDQPVSVNHVLATLGALLGKKPQVEHHPSHAADVEITWADICKSRALLNWSPAVPLDEGLRRTVDWYIANRSALSQMSFDDRA